MRALWFIHRRLRAVKTLLRPITLTEVFSFLRLVGYYKRLVKDCEHRFEVLKDTFTSTPVLALQEGSNGYGVYYDSCGIVLGFILMQYGKVIIYDSR
ncbi:hypothetical protein MTR67_051770 [Solanum verrucosum]|uniref:Reverse transcriptase/retrotransposon-derived protein RNase H-like domain-containing protein n=1 Tax=Solanum verrucosum TaxID=315347 RepID=A0AAF1A2R2_SOLVR|nr:hypothetical protein MTR67_051770 [Solanum verrucosum]